jgi:hypothetical protein
MHLVLLMAWLAQAPKCAADEVLALADAGRLVRTFDLAGAVDRLSGTSPDCETTQIALLYFRGLQAAKAAYPNGGDEASLAPVMQAISELERYAATNPRADLLRVMLMAAAAAAQSERGDMTLMLDQAATLEEKLLASGASGAPGVSARETAGDLWLQVHRFETARAAYHRASELFGPSPGIALGLARVAVRLADDVGACDGYRRLVSQWSNPTLPPELVEARTFAASSHCGNAPGRGPARHATRINPMCSRSSRFTACAHWRRPDPSSCTN